MQVAERVIQRKQWVGTALRRFEDLHLITGGDTFTDNIKLPNLLYATLYRSPYASATIRKIDLSEVSAAPGVVALMTGEEATRLSRPITCYWRFPNIKVPSRPNLAAKTVRYVGEPVVAIAAENRYAAEDAVELVNVNFEPLPPIVDVEKAIGANSPRVHDEFSDNIVYHLPTSGGDVERALQNSDVVIDEKFRVQRLAASAMENRVVLAFSDRRTGQMTVWSSTQWPHILRTALADSLGINENSIRVIAPDVGGGFGPKGEVYVEEVITCLLSMKTGRPVLWTETRSESYISTTHSRDQTIYAKAGFTKDGLIKGLKAKLICDFGAYLQTITPGTPFLTFLSLNGPYHLKDFAVDVYGVFTNKVPSSAYRGFGQNEAAFVMERIMDMAADKLGLDAAEIRFRNFIKPEEFPYRTMSGGMYDSGNYQGCLRRALQVIDYEKILATQAEARRRGDYVGVGIGFFQEATGLAPSKVFSLMGLQLGGYDSATVKMDPSGKVTLAVGTSPHGQGLATSLSQVVADEFGIKPADVRVIHGDTSIAPYGQGTFASRSMVVAGTATVTACRNLKTKLLRLAAHLLKVDAHELEMQDGKILARAPREKALGIGDVARAAYIAQNLPEGMDPGLESTSYYDPAGIPTSYAAHIVVVRVDQETGLVKLERFVVVHDCGVVVNPLIVEGQIHGAVAQGIGQTLLEELVYNDEGQLLSSSFMDYLLPTATDVPMVDVEHQETPTPLNPLGVKGMGEGGTIVSPVAIANAVAKALSPLKIKVTETPLKPDRIWRLLAAGNPLKA